MNMWNTIKEKRVMIIQLSFSNEINEGSKVPYKTNHCPFSAVVCLFSSEILLTQLLVF